MDGQEQREEQDVRRPAVREAGQGHDQPAHRLEVDPEQDEVDDLKRERPERACTRRRPERENAGVGSLVLASQSSSGGRPRRWPARAACTGAGSSSTAGDCVWASANRTAQTSGQGQKRASGCDREIGSHSQFGLKGSAESTRQETAIDHERVSGDVAPGVARQHEHRPDQLVRLAPAIQRRRLGELPFSSADRMLSGMSVRNGPGAMQLTVTPSWPRSSALAWASPINAALLAE